jgi:hypothetical protein
MAVVQVRSVFLSTCADGKSADSAEADNRVQDVESIALLPNRNFIVADAGDNRVKLLAWNANGDGQHKSI